jgi:transposase-like protein
VKYCPVCATYKDEVEFHTRTASGDGLQSRCKSCKREYNQEYHAARVGWRRALLAEQFSKLGIKAPGW